MSPSGSPRIRLEATEVGYTYRGQTPTRALEGLNLSVVENEFVALLGPVGCGKTTLLRIFAGFLKPTPGVVRCDGASVEGPSWQKGYVLQEAAIFPWMRVRENIEFGLLAKGMEAPARRAISDEWLSLLGLSTFEAAYPKELSAGMSKMVEVARTRARMQDELARLWEQRRKTVVFVTHDVEEAVYLADRIVVLSPRPGRVKQQFSVSLPRPRSLDTRFAGTFSSLKREVWQVIG